ncbi:hypothetical protein Lal_00028235 [Lupinus albus]|nr:hypothetical protein Lal_00028235 [Lupinus albus]
MTKKMYEIEINKEKFSRVEFRVVTHSEYSDSVHSVAFPNFDHSVHSENMAQPPTPPGPRERTLRELAAPDLTYDSLSIIDAASGGALGDMTPSEERCLIEKMASNYQQFNERSGDAIVVRGVHDVGTNTARKDKLETKIDSLTTLITQLAINHQKSSMARVCGICTSSDHFSDMCPSLLEPRTDDHPEAPPHQQQHYDPPSSSTYNLGWRNQAPFQNNNVGQNRSSYVPPPIQQQRHQMINTPAATEPSLEELVRQMTMQNMQFQQETRASIQRQESSIQNLTTHMGQMATSLNTLQSHSDKLPSQTVFNPRNVSAITLTLGKQIEVPTPRTDFVLQKEHDASKRNKSRNSCKSTFLKCAQQPFSIPLPFPPKIISTKKMGNMEELDKDLLDTIRKVEVNIPLLDAIKQIPRYAMFLKELCTYKRKLKGNERINMGRNVSAMIGNFGALELFLGMGIKNSRLSERFSPGRGRLTWKAEILGYTGGFSPERGLSRLGEKWHFGAVETVRCSLERESLA